MKVLLPRLANGRVNVHAITEHQMLALHLDENAAELDAAFESVRYYADKAEARKAEWQEAYDERMANESIAAVRRGNLRYRA